MYSGDESMNLVTGDEVDKPGDVVIQLSYVSFLSVLDGLLGTSIKRTECFTGCHLSLPIDVDKYMAPLLTMSTVATAAPGRSSL